MTKRNKETVVEMVELEKKSHCLACGGELRRHNILVCAECLDDECDKFMKIAESIDTDK
ncbi:MAG TPA: hypothetical protein VM577_09145 [Anaerovoracaceae bacterium]|nr:hypothetical protein [Anaerovoracaceae bacterium]